MIIFSRQSHYIIVVYYHGSFILGGGVGGIVKSSGVRKDLAISSSTRHAASTVSTSHVEQGMLGKMNPKKFFLFSSKRRTEDTSLTEK